MGEICKCGKQASGELHSCPFALDVHGVEEECNCCADCELNCHDQI